MAKSPDHPHLNFVQAAGYTKGRPDGPPLWIVVHDMEAGESSDRAESTAAYFATGSGGRQVSAHFCVDDNSVVQCVLLKDTAWTVGNRPGNNRGINWEFAGFARQTRAQWLDAFGQAMFREAAPIIRADAKRFNIPLRRCTVADLRAFRPGVTSHNDLRLAFGVTDHTDPGPNFPWDVFLKILQEEPMTIAELHALLLSILTADTAPERQVRDMIQGGVQSPAGGKGLLSPLSEKVTALQVDVAALHAKIDAIGTSDPDVAAILAGVDERLAALRADVEDDTRDAVADLAEGGAPAVRADA